MRNHCAGLALTQSADTLDSGTHVSQRVRMSMKPRLDIKASELPLQMRTRSNGMERETERTKIKVMCVYINSQQLPLRKKEILFIVGCERNA